MRSAFDAEHLSLSPMDIELEPEQPEEVVRAVANLVADDGAPTDPWWQAGLDDALDT